MEEYAITVYTLVEHALRFDAEQKMWEIIASRMAFAKEGDVRRLMSRLERASRDILEQEDYDINKLKAIFGAPKDNG